MTSLGCVPEEASLEPAETVYGTPVDSHDHHLSEDFVDKRGLTALGGASIAVGLGVLGALIDLATGSGLRTVFAILFIAGCAISAALVHTEDLLAAVIMPPLVYLGLAFLGASIQHSNLTGGWFRQQTIEMASSLVLNAPTLIIATIVSVVIAVLRRSRSRAA